MEPPPAVASKRLKLRFVRRGTSTLERAIAILSVIILSGSSLVTIAEWSGKAALVSAVLVAIVGAVVARARQRRGGEARLEQNGIDVRSAGWSWRITTRAIESAYVIPHTKMAVLLLRDGRRVHLAVEEDDPRRILEHVGQTLEKRALSAPLRGTLGAFTIGLLGSLVVAPLATLVLTWLARLTGVEIVILSWPLVTLAGSIFLGRRLGRPKVIVGADGVKVVRALSSRFIPFAQIRSVANDTRDFGGVTLELDAGESIWLPTIGQERAQRNALVERIREGSMKQHPSGPSAADRLAVGNRSVRAWREDLARLAASVGGFRDAAVQATDLEAELANPRSPIERRLGAALALRSLDPAAVARIRVAAATTVDEHVRVALEAAAADELDDARIEGALRRRI